MSDRVALVTGASRGIGRACAIQLAGSGMNVAVNYNTGADEAKETLKAVEAAGAEGICIHADVAEAASVARMFEEVHQALGPVSVLVNNAGIRRDGLMLGMRASAWSEVVDVGLRGAFECSRVALKDMLRSRWGRIVNIGSVAGLRGSAGQTNYAAAKAGLIGLSKSLAREVAQRGITVNVVAPGLVETEMTTSLTGAQWDSLVSTIPAGRAGSPQEVANLVAFVCSEEAAYLNGSVLVIDGGMAA